MNEEVKALVIQFLEEWVSSFVSANGSLRAYWSFILLSRYYGLYDGDSREKLLEAYGDNVS